MGENRSGKHTQYTEAHMGENRSGKQTTYRHIWEKTGQENTQHTGTYGRKQAEQYIIHRGIYGENRSGMSQKPEKDTA